MLFPETFRRWGAERMNHNIMGHTVCREKGQLLQGEMCLKVILTRRVMLSGKWFTWATGEHEKDRKHTQTSNPVITGKIKD